MNQKQHQGGKDQVQSLPGNNKEKTNPQPAENSKKIPQPEKPAVTDDAGNAVEKKNRDAGKGYSEIKQTEPWSDVPPLTGDKSPAGNQKDPVKKDEKTAQHSKIIHEHKDLPQQLSQEEKGNSEKRIRQSGNVEG